MTTNSSRAIRRLLQATLPGAMLLLAGCQNLVEDGDIVSSTNAQFGGWTEGASGNEIAAQALNQQSGVFETIGLVDQGTQPISADVIGSLYKWSQTVNFTTLPNKNCYFGQPGTCELPTSGSVSAEIRFVQQTKGGFPCGASGSCLQDILYTFPQGAKQCVQDEIATGVGAGLASINCLASPGFSSAPASFSIALQNVSCLDPFVAATTNGCIAF